MNNAMESVRTAETIALEINVIKGRTRDVILRSAIEIGRRLYEAKAIVPYGKWGGWLKENVDYSERTAQNLMKCFDEYGKNPQALADVSYSQAVALLSLDGEQRAELMERVDVSELSTRELQSEITRLKEEQAQRQVTLEQLMAEKEEARSAAEALASAQEESRKAAAGAEERAKDFAERANVLMREKEALKRELEEEKARPAPEPETVIQQVEVVPEEVQQELEMLRKRSKELENAAITQREALEDARRAAQAERRSEMEVRVREAYNDLVQRFSYVRTLLKTLEQERADVAARYRRAIAKAAEKMAAEINGAQEAD